MDLLEGAELAVDAVFGAGLSRPVEGLPAEVLRAVVTSRTISSTEDLATTILGIGRYLNVRR